LIGYLLSKNSVITCPHGGTVTPVTANAKVFVGGQPVLTQPDTFTVSGCASVSPASGPCVNVKWTTAASRVRINGQPALLQESVGVCESADQTAQGAPVVVSTQLRVRGV